MDKEIKEIWFNCLQNSGNPNRYTVGELGVTKIERFSYSPEPYCYKEYFRVFVGEEAVADIHNPEEVYYG